jgi:ATP synthase F1 epsilon subunit
VITLEIVTITGTKLSQEVYEVMVPTENGIIAVFQNHDDLISLVKPGILSYRKLQDTPESGLEHLAVSSGSVIVEKNRVRLLVDEATEPQEVIEAEVKEAIEKAKQAKLNAKTNEDINYAEQMLAQQQVKLRVADLKRRSKR